MGRSRWREGRKREVRSVKSEVRRKSEGRRAKLPVVACGWSRTGLVADFHGSSLCVAPSATCLTPPASRGPRPWGVSLASRPCPRPMYLVGRGYGRASRGWGERCAWAMARPEPRPTKECRRDARTTGSWRVALRTSDFGLRTSGFERRTSALLRTSPFALRPSLTCPPHFSIKARRCSVCTAGRRRRRCRIRA
jgi:hypothetical protein